MKNKFKVGDRVHFTTAGEKVFKIVSIDSTQIPYELESIDNLDETFFTIESNIKLIPTMKNIKDLGEKVAIQCKTQEEWDFVRNNAVCKVPVYFNPEFPCIIINGSYCSLCTLAHFALTLYQASDFMPLSPQDEIKELKERIATLEETLRPKKKIEVLKLITETFGITNSVDDSCDYDNVELVCKYTNFDIIKAWDNGDDPIVFLGHFNDGIK